MPNPYAKSHKPFWIKRVVARLGGERGALSAWMAAVLLCAALAGAISLVKFSSKKKESDKGKSAAVAVAESSAKAVPAQTGRIGQTHQTAQKPASHPKLKGTIQPQAHQQAENIVSGANAVAQTQPSAVTIPFKPVVLAPPVDLTPKERGEEASDISKQRANWFFEQRAYPNKHIPEGAFQKALADRDAMKARQRAAGSTSAVNIINFPGDALWHLMGPQPINNPLGTPVGGFAISANGGFPTASGRVTAIAVDPSTPSTVYIGGAAGGVWKSTDSGVTWTPLTDNQPSLAIGSIAIDPNSCSSPPCTTIYVGTGEENFNGDAFYGAGILKSTNGGTTWAQVGATTFAQVLGPSTGGAYIGSIAVQPGNSSIILAAVSFFVNGNIGGIYRSTDGGNTWAEDASPQGLAATSVFFESTGVGANPPIAWAAMGNPFGEAVNGVYRSTDSGATWTKQTSVLPTVNVGRVILGYGANTTGASATVYAAIADSSTNSSSFLGFFKTANGGTSWTQLTNTPLFCNSTIPPTPPPLSGQCFYDMAIGVSPANASVVVVGGGAYTNNFTSLFESQNGGTTWTIASANGQNPSAGDFAWGSTTTHVHVDTHAIVFAPSGGTLYVGDDGGIWSTTTPTPASGVSPTWNDLNGPLALAQFYPGATAAISDENSGFGGTQDNDAQAFQNSLLWQAEAICGDGGFTAIDKTTPSTIYAGCNTTAGTKVMKAVLNGQFETFFNGQVFPGFDRAETAITNSNDAMQFIPPLTNDDGNPENVYFGTCRVWATNNAASSLANTFIPLTPTWNAISGDLSNGNAATAQCLPVGNGGTGYITNLEVAHSNSGVIVAGTTNGKVWETTSSGALWTEIDAGALPNRTVTSVRTERGDSTGNIVYVTLSGFGACAGCGASPGHVFVSTNAAGGAPTWTNISGDLPDIPVNDMIAFHQGSPAYDALYIATDVGVFSCPNPATTRCSNWTVIGDGLPNSPVLGLSMRRSSRILRAATHGRSMWDIQLTDVNPPSLAALSSVTPGAVNVVIGGAGNTALTVTGVNFSSNTQLLFDGSTTGVTTTFASTTQLNVTLSNTLLQAGGVHRISLTDPAGVDSGSSLLAGGGGPFTVMDPMLDPASMTPASALTYTAVPFHLTAGAGSATEPFFPNSVLAFYDTTNTILQLQLPASGTSATVSGGGSVYDYTAPITTFTAPGTYNVVPYNPAPGGGIDALSITAAGAGGKVPFTFTVTANPNPLGIVNPNPILLTTALGTTSPVLTVSITNPGGAALNITAQSITGTNSGNFSFAAPTSGTTCNFPTTGQSGSGTITLAAGGGTCNFGLTYFANSATPGNANSVATLNVTDNASNSQAIPITGVPTTSASLILLTPVNFGAVAIGATSATMNATLLNDTSSSVNVTSAFSISGGTNPADFHSVAFVSNGDGLSVCPAPPFALAAFSACDTTLTFTPSVAGTETANLTVTTAAGSPSAGLTGVGVQITSISPSIVATGGPAFTLTVNGGGFASSAVVNVSSINGTNVLPRLTTFVSANQLLASIPASDIVAPGSLAITVTTPVPGGTPSEPKTLIVAQAPVATNDDIAFATNVTTTPFRITQDTTRATTNTGGFTDPTSPLLTCAPGTATLGGSAKSVWFAFKAPATGRVIADTRFSSYPAIVSVWTTNAPTFTTFTQVACNSGNVPTTPAESLAGFAVTSGTTYYIMVTDATSATLPATAPGGTLTFSLDFASTAPGNDPFSSPTNITSTPFSTTENTILATANTGATDPTPSCAPAGAASGGVANSVWFSYTPSTSGTITADTLTSPYETILTAVTGAPGTFTQVACNSTAGSGISQSQVSVAATSGTQYFFMVSSVLGDGGTTNFHLTFTASGSNPVPTITSFSPTSATAGGAAFALTINGTNFVSGATGTFNGVARTVTFVSATQVTMAVTAGDIAAAGSFPVIISNPAPGGGPSAPMSFPVNNPVPTTTSISPTSATAGGAGFTLTVNGTNFNASSVVNFNGTAKTTTFVNATQVTATINAADIAAAGTVNVTVTNPAPGGGTSNAQTFTINNPAPAITSLSPTGATAGGAAFTLTVNGTGFVSTSSVKFNGNARTTTFVGATQVTAAILATDIASAGSFPVTVTNPAPGGGTSASVAFNVSAASNPVPTLTSISPTSATAGGAAFTLTLTGTNFIASSTVNFGANPPLVPTTQTSTQLQVTVPATDIATAGSVNVTVTNPAPGGGTSSAQTFNINNPAATIASFSPTSATAGGAAFTLTIHGSNFVSGATGTFNGAARTVTFVSSTQVTMAVTAPDIAAAGSFPVVVSNPAPGGGSNGAVLFPVNNVVPTLTSISPTSATVGGAAFTLTLNGTGFFSGSTVKFGTAAPAATFVSSTQLTAAITAPDIATAGVVTVSVTNPAPGGGTSGTQNFSINNPVPAITSFSPTSATAGGAAFTLTINGTNFVSGATGTFNGTARTVTFVSATQVTMAVTAPDIVTGGSFPVVVSNPGPGGGASAPSNFTVNNPVPTITSFVPASAIAGGAAFSLTINGTNFVNGVTGAFNAAPRTVTFVSSTQITMAVTAADIAAAGTYPVVITNPAPGGGIAASNFVVNNPVPTITSFVPANATAGGAAFTLTINGTNFVLSPTGTFNGVARTVTFVNPTQVTMAVTAADISTAGTFPVVISNPGPGGGASAPMNFQVNNPAPTITTLSPNGATAGGPAFTLTVNGTGFVSTSSVKFNGNARATTFVSAVQVTAAITAADIATAGSVPVTVTNPAPGGGTSASVSFNISVANNPVPTLTSISPTNATAGGAAFTLTATGTNFVSTSLVNFNGAARTTTFVSATQVTAAITAADIANGGVVNVTITNPAPGGGTTAAQSFTINNPAPTITTLSPTSAAAGGAGFTLTVNGTGFVASSSVKFNGNVRTTTFVSATQVTAAITAADIATAGTFGVTVTNPAPAGGTSAATNFTVNNPAPTITSLSPTSATAGGAAFTLTVNGTNFVAASVVNFNGAAKTTTFASATQITAAITAADIATAGTFGVTVTNPAPGGGTSTATNFTVNNPAPAITSLSPTGATAGGAAFTLTVNGTGFVSPSSVKFNGNAKTTTFVSATQLTAAITAADIATAGNANVTVTNPAPGGGTSTVVVFNIASAPNPVPTLASISPTNVTAGGAAFTLTVNGTNYVSSSVVNFNGSARTTTVVSGTQLTASITAADIATAGSFPITVFNPAPGGGTSSAINLAVNNPIPSISSLSPASATIGSAAFTLTINGSSFVSGATGTFNGNARTVTFVSSTQVTMAVTAADLGSTGSFPVVISNPPPGGGASAAAMFAVNNPVPTITTLSQNSAIAGGGSFPLIIDGTNFAAGATVNFGANPALTPTTETAFQIMVIVPFTDIATAGNVNVTVTNPAPGGGTSAPAVFTIDNPLPTITSLAPTNATAGGAAFVLTVNGTGFVTGQSLIKFNGNAKTTTVVSATQATAPITAADIATAGNFPVTVTNAAPGGGVSAATNFTVNNPVPTLTSIAPTSGVVNQSVNLVLTGTGFVAGSIVNFGANADAGGVVSNGGNTLTITIPAAQLNTAGPVNATVNNPAPGGGTTAAQVFTVNNPAPTLTSLAPTSGVLGQSVNLVLTGTGFITGSVVNFGTNADAGGVVSNGGNTLTITIPAAQLSTAGPVNVTVKNLAPGGGTSAAQTFTVNNPVPTITPPLSPASANAGGAAFVLTITGTKFVTGATVNFGSNPALTPTTITAATITVTVPAADIATGGTPNVTVTNPAPGGGASNAVPFTVSNPVPTVASVNSAGLSHVPGGAAFTLTVTGTNFVATSVINFGVGAVGVSKPEPTTFVSATQINAAIPASDVSTAGAANVTVTNPSPGGGTTAANTSFTVDGYTVSGPAQAPSVVAGKSVPITITLTPSANGFANAVSFTVSGLPKHSTGMFSSASLTPGTKTVTTTLTVQTTSNGALPPSAPVDPPTTPLLRLLPLLWLAAMLVGAYTMKLSRRVPQLRRYAAIVPLALLLVTGAILAGCAGQMNGTPKGPAQITVTAMSGTMTQSTNITLTVQ